MQVSVAAADREPSLHETLEWLRKHVRLLAGEDSKKGETASKKRYDFTARQRGAATELASDHDDKSGSDCTVTIETLWEMGRKSGWSRTRSRRVLELSTLDPEKLSVREKPNGFELRLATKKGAKVIKQTTEYSASDTKKTSVSSSQTSGFGIEFAKRKDAERVKKAVGHAVSLCSKDDDLF